jgi:CPA1 family monovalent cation:H+ antiporter
MSDLVQFESLVLVMLLIVSLVAIGVRRVRLPYTVALVLAGLAVSLSSPPQFVLTGEIILGIFLPPLLFEAAFHLHLDELRRNYLTIGLLAIPGVVMTMLVVGGILSAGAGLGIGVALVFGALIAATDPVSVVAIFRKLGAPKRLEVLLEGESLFNDGTAIVLFGIALTAFEVGEFAVLDGVIDFFAIAGGGVIVGLLLGWIALQLIGRLDDYLVQTTLTTIVAYGSFLVAEQLHVSGVLAVVTAGVINGNIGHREMSPTSRIVVLNFWEYVAFLANSAVFLLIGLAIDVNELINSWQLILWAIGAVLVARAIGIYLLSRLGPELPGGWRHVLFWGGLRGAIALALALSLPETMGAERQTLISMTFGVVLFTLLIQGTSMDWFVRQLRLITRSEERIEYERRRARALIARSGFEHMQSLYQDGLISLHTWERVQPVLRDRVDALANVVQESLQQAPTLEADELVAARREELRAQRGMLANLRRDGVISEETYEQLGAEVDAALDLTHEVWPAGVFDFGMAGDIANLIVAVIQNRDLEGVSNALALRNIPSTRVKTTGGFLRQRNHTLLIGVDERTLDQAVIAIRTAARERVEFVSAIPGTEESPLALGEQVRVHGANVFVLNVERFEAI